VLNLETFQVGIWGNCVLATSTLNLNKNGHVGSALNAGCFNLDKRFSIPFGRAAFLVSEQIWTKQRKQNPLSLLRT